MNNHIKAQGALLATNIFFAINFTAIKYLVNGGYAQPFGINLVRVLVCTALLWMLFFFRKEKTVFEKNDYGRLLLSALTGIAINQMLFVKGLSLTYPIHASLLMLTTPILITILAALVLKERLSNYKITGLAAGISGAALLVAGAARSGSASNVLWGDTLIILNAISYTFYFILVKPLMAKYNMLAVVRMVFTLGLFMMLPFCWKDFIAINWAAYGFLQYLSMALIVIGGTFLAYLFNIYGIKMLGASKAGFYIYFQPVFAAAIAIIILHEELTVVKVLAGLLIALGVYLTNKKTSNA
ncbi:MAG: DMT family transporter [Ferruginibacter sp.]